MRAVVFYLEGDVLYRDQHRAPDGRCLAALYGTPGLNNKRWAPIFPDLGTDAPRSTHLMTDAPPVMLKAWACVSRDTCLAAK